MRTALLLIFTILLSVGGVAQETKSRMVKFDGVKINYYDVGNAKADSALVFVHCWTCNAEFWRDSIKAFPNHRVLAMDLPGHGTSDKPKRDYSIDYFAKSVNAVMKHAGVKRAVLAGHSMGTPIVRKYYELYPDKTLGLIIVDGALLPYGNREELEKFFAPMFADYAGNAPRFLDGMLPTTMDDKLRVFIRSSMLSTPDYVAVSAMKLMNEDAYAKHGTISVPVLSVMAPSAFWPKDIEAKYRGIAPNHEFLMWPGTTHFLQMERPKEFNEAVAAFIAKNKLL
jgi:pimeloyl-ACP methyl ester carboxylesterase